MKFFQKIKKTITAEEFWQWFAENKQQIENVHNDPAIFERLMDKAQKYSKHIEFLIGKPKDVFQLFVSCNGIRDGIPAVQELVVAAPSIAGWEIIAFKQPLPASEFKSKEQSSIMYDNQYEVDAVTASFALDKNGELHNLTIFSPPDRMEPGHKFAYYLLLDMLLGEYFVMTKLGSIEMMPKDNADRPALYRLPDYLLH